MKRALIIVAMACMYLGSAKGQKQDSPGAKLNKTEQQIMALNLEWADAIVRGDVAALDRLFADDMIVTAGNGEVRTKAQEMDDLKPDADITTYFFNTDDVRVRVYKDAAVVTGRARWRIKYRGRDIDNQRRYTSVYVKQRGRWRIVAQQLTRLPQQ
jgi:ketosteroid isomerase-like protein